MDHLFGFDGVKQLLLLREGTLAALRVSTRLLSANIRRRINSEFTDYNNVQLRTLH